MRFHLKVPGDNDDHDPQSGHIDPIMLQGILPHTGPITITAPTQSARISTSEPKGRTHAYIQAIHH